MTQTQTHELRFTATEVRKRYVSWDRGEGDREWGCLTLLAKHALGVAPRPLRRATDGDAPVVVTERLRGTALGEVRLTSAQTTSIGAALHRLDAVPYRAIIEAGITERLYGPSTLPRAVTEWLSDADDLTLCQDPGLVAAATRAAFAWLGSPDALPSAQLVALGISDHPANIIWDGQTCRLVDFEDGVSPTRRPSWLTTPSTLPVGSEGPPTWRGRLHGGSSTRSRWSTRSASLMSNASVCRPNGRCGQPSGLAMLLPGNGGFRRNPPGTTEAQAQHLLEYLA